MTLRFSRGLINKITYEKAFYLGNHCACCTHYLSLLSLFTLTGAVELPVDVDVVVLPVVRVPRVVVPQAAGLGVAVARLLAPWFRV